MISKTLLNRDMNAILTHKNSDEFAKNGVVFKGHLKKDNQVVFEDGAMGYKTTLLTTLDEVYKVDLKLKDELVELETSQKYIITSLLKENKTLMRIVLEKAK
ncbi:hypothetical protein [Helicobacter cappadocius]|uniref:Uncharacterized protein n=1 Tax=Helicobacter cappadocius TaxID=3063998 RepID=A0AA90PKP2_9HELI|nr:MULTISPECIES: hypothetical protein [unclassified Helicobacter]MDO7253885.1 hypothetical protein [Helicobacter sp. faydin-H75]MDP2539746.1 hypothetical protein [Helicobacter sp. faydin-H76]